MSLVRSKWLSYLAKSSESDLVGLYESTGLDPSYTYLRKPEIGTIMATARIGNSGQKFNAGEISVTRCSIQLEDGKLVGHGYVQGRSKKKSTVAALCDALMQSDKRTLI
jgi:alpha-D-ribose 1-methylphosphonate 5-triphosphate synthase subunit PhnG